MKITPDQVRAIRLSLGWSQTKLAEYMRLDSSSVSRMERKDGLISGPAAVLLEQLAEQNGPPQ
jgi:transcriptional regulator with XRE-family HTH domain